MIERETKYLLTINEFLLYEEILNKEIAADRNLHINYYYDSPDHILHKAGTTLRVRQQQNKLILQYKFKKMYKDSERICREYEKAIENFPVYISSSALPDASTHEKFYYYIGNLVSDRIEYKYKNTKISLDKNYYLGRCDYEIEVEYLCFNEAHEILRLLSINKDKMDNVGKYSRFIEAQLQNHISHA